MLRRDFGDFVESSTVATKQSPGAKSFQQTGSGLILAQALVHALMERGVVETDLQAGASPRGERNRPSKKRHASFRLQCIRPDVRR